MSWTNFQVNSSAPHVSFKRVGQFLSYESRWVIKVPGWPSFAQESVVCLDGTAPAGWRIQKSNPVAISSRTSATIDVTCPPGLIIIPEDETFLGIMPREQRKRGFEPQQVRSLARECSLRTSGLWNCELRVRNGDYFGCLKQGVGWPVPRGRWQGSVEQLIGIFFSRSLYSFGHEEEHPYRTEGARFACRLNSERYRLPRRLTARGDPLVMLPLF